MPVHPNDRKLIEAILLAERTEADVERLSSLSGILAPDVREILGELSRKYSREDSGIELVEMTGGVWLVPNRDFTEQLRSIYGRRRRRLSRAALETLAIIAYRQPVTRGRIRDVRGVDPAPMLKLLMDKELVRIDGRQEDVAGKPLTYGTTKEFLRWFQLRSLGDLPREKEIKDFDFLSDEIELTDE